MSEFEKTPIPKIKPLAPTDIPNDFAEVGAVWLLEQAQDFLSEPERGFALIHADDGVLWARVENERLVTQSFRDWVADLRTPTIQQCRVFSERGELFIWRESEGVWRGRILIDDGANYETLLEKHILWGNRAHVSVNGFTPIYEEGSGLRHLVPLVVTPADLGDENTDEKKKKRVTLTVCHYLSEDEDGQSLIYCSRLQTIEVSRIDD